MAIYTRIGTAALRQLSFDFMGNIERILDAIERAQHAQLSVLLLPEMALTGYGCEDNFIFQEFNDATQTALEQVIKRVGDLSIESTSSAEKPLLVALGMPLMYPGGQVYNATAIISQQGLHGFSLQAIFG